MREIEIPRQESGTVRVFAVSLPIPEMSRRLKKEPKAAIAADLLSHPVDDRDIELFALSDLAGLGLGTYLSEGYAIPKDVVNADRARLDNLDGYVLLVHSSIARDAPVTLSLGASLTLIGTYVEPRASRAAAPLQAEAARPYSAAKPPAPNPIKSRLGSLLGLGMVGLIFLILWLVMT